MGRRKQKLIVVHGLREGGSKKSKFFTAVDGEQGGKVRKL